MVFSSTAASKMERAPHGKIGCCHLTRPQGAGDFMLIGTLAVVQMELRPGCQHVHGRRNNPAVEGCRRDWDLDSLAAADRRVDLRQRGQASVRKRGIGEEHGDRLPGDVEVTTATRRRHRRWARSTQRHPQSAGHDRDSCRLVYEYTGACRRTEMH